MILERAEDQGAGRDRRLFSIDDMRQCARCRALDNSRLATRCIVSQTILLLLLSRVAFGQSPSADATSGHGFVAVAPFSMTDDAQARLRGGLAADESPWLVDAPVFLRPNTGISVELMPLGSVTRQQYYHSFESNDAEDDGRAVLIMTRARAFAKRRFALDMVFGGGVVSQHWVFHSVEHSFPPVVTDRILDHHSPAVGVGVDGPLSLVPHLALVPLVRLYLVNHNGEGDSDSGWTSRVAIGIGAGVKW